jgi:hypothetical protein
MPMSRADAESTGPRVVIVGPCASGKTTLARNLREIGVDAVVSGQEHSEIRNLWQRQQPDMVIGLNLDLETLRARRGASWSQALYDTQQRRLGPAFAAASIVLDTGKASETEVVTEVMQQLGLAAPDDSGGDPATDQLTENDPPA